MTEINDPPSFPSARASVDNMAQKTFIPLENNPEVMTRLSHKLGLSSSLSFHDVYSLTDPDLLAIVPRPAAALLFIYPITSSSESYFTSHDSSQPYYDGSGRDEPVMFYHQTIRHACGLYGLLHCISNGSSTEQIKSGSDLDTLIREATPLQPKERAQFLYDSEMLEKAHAEAAQTGNSIAPPLGEDPGHAFIAFVKGKDGSLWELEGRQKGPVNRGSLAEDEDVLSERALILGPLPYLKREEDAGNGEVRFSCIALAPSIDG